MTPSAENLCRQVFQRLPGLAALLETAGDRLLTDHVRMLGASLPPPVQSRHDLPACLGQTPVALTANHHGLDTLAQSWQSTLAFSLPHLLAGTPRPVPVLATGLPSLNNITFPAGLLCSNFSPHTDETRIIRLPLLPARLRQTMAAVAPPVTQENLRRACRAVREDLRLLPVQKTPALALLEAFADDLPGNRFVEQAARWNRRLWTGLFADGQAPPLEFLELEAVTTALLTHDLVQPSSLLWGLLWDEGIRERLLTALDGCAGCWNLDRLNRLARMRCQDAPGHDDLAGAGTCFFWAADAKGRQTPLRLESTSEGWRLTGVCRDGTPVVWPWEPAAVLEGLATRRLLPSLFTSYAALALARGVACVGGVYQSAYLARMVAGTAQALREAGQPGLAAQVGGIAGDWFLAGVHLLFVQAGGILAPAHAMDALTTGPLQRTELQAMGRLTLRQAVLAGLVQTYGEVAPREERPAGWRDILCNHAVAAWAPGLSVRALRSGTMTAPAVF
ncbi:hypothetical protein [Megalodesulfovibrio gigas]|uniref:Uncharacterized protein n=1 Tax=Megalodesulfovibrio gigas (strain ATCC 19364 / DSM 1382 / NCIMB 9332 / VKM B-1759) TaxID=1121448 RepID=T2GFG9_MEGG1|nr:hypothetical protein [Megalodesulfovibrio gigas]AGW14642.1 hypothetical protein DGI_2916 [Megalodesulfovibrio gigas DSM 1382 = ATCC 19364]